MGHAHRRADSANLGGALALLAIVGLMCSAFGCEQNKPEKKRATTSSATSSTSANTADKPKEVKPIKLGIAISSYVHAIAWIARDSGAAERELIAPEVEVMGGSAATLRALIGGSIDVGLAGGDAVLKARAAGADVVVVAGFVNRFYHRIVGGEQIATMQDLRGKKIGLGFLGGPQDTAVKVALEMAKLDYDKDVEVMNLGKEFNRMAALRGGDIHATTSQTPPAKLKEMGLHVLSDLPATDEPFPYAMLIVKRSVLEERPEEIEATLAALCAASDFYRDKPDESLKIIGENIRGSDTADAARERYDLAGPAMISDPPTPDMKGFETVIRHVSAPGGKTLSIEGAVDTSLLEKLQAEGKCTGEPKGRE